jgi:hypothetical protein
MAATMSIHCHQFETAPGWWTCTPVRAANVTHAAALSANIQYSGSLQRICSKASNRAGFRSSGISGPVNADAANFYGIMLRYGCAHLPAGTPRHKAHPDILLIPGVGFTAGLRGL